MRLSLCLLAVLLAPSVGAQGAPSPTPSDRAVLVGGALVGAVATSWSGPFMLASAGAGTYVASAALGLDPTLGGVVLDTAVGTGVALVTSMAVFHAVTEVGGQPSDPSTAVGSLLTGIAVGSAAVGVAHGVRLAALRAPTGTAPGLAVTVAL